MYLLDEKQLAKFPEISNRLAALETQIWEQ
jgi:hypothetical protein